MGNDTELLEWLLSLPKGKRERQIKGAKIVTKYLRIPTVEVLRMAMDNVWRPELSPFYKAK